MAQKPDDWNEGAHPYGVSFGCEHGEYNDLATALLSRPPETIRRMFSLTNEVSVSLTKEGKFTVSGADSKPV